MYSNRANVILYVILYQKILMLGGKVEVVQVTMQMKWEGKPRGLMGEGMVVCREMDMEEI